MKQFEASIDQLHEMIEYILQQLRKAPLKASRIKQIELASEEVIVNIIHHAYKDLGGKIGIQVEMNPEEVRLVFTDFGLSFDPVGRKEENVAPQSLEEQKIGGLGLLLIHRFADEILYQRENGKNWLVLIVKITDSSQKR